MKAPVYLLLLFCLGFAGRNTWAGSYGEPVRAVANKYHDKAYEQLDEAIAFEKNGDEAVKRAEAIRSADVHDAAEQVRISEAATAALQEAKKFYGQCVEKAEEGIETTKTGKEKTTKKKESVDEDTCQPLLDNPKTAAEGATCKRDTAYHEKKGHKSLDKVKKKLEDRKATCSEKRDHSGSVAEATSTVTDNGEGTLMASSTSGFGNSVSGPKISSSFGGDTDDEDPDSIGGPNSETSGLVGSAGAAGASGLSSAGGSSLGAANVSASGLSMNNGVLPFFAAGETWERGHPDKPYGTANSNSTLSTDPNSALRIENGLTMVTNDGRELTLWERATLNYNGREGNGAPAGWRAKALAQFAFQSSKKELALIQK